MKLENKTFPCVAETATITFNKSEMEFLSTILQHIGGNPAGPRGHADRLNDMLRGLGYTWEHMEKTEAYRCSRTEYGIMFDFESDL